MKSLIIAGRLIRQIQGDRRTLALMILAPVLIMTLLYYMLGAGVTTVRLDMVSAETVDISALDGLAEVHFVADEAEAAGRLLEGESDGYIAGDRCVAEGTDPAVTALVTRAFTAWSLQSKLAELPPQAAALAGGLGEPAAVETYYGGDEYEQFDFLAPSMMGFIIFFLVFLLAGIAFLRERISGTLERVMATSLRRRDLVGGYFLGFGLFAALQTVVIQAFLIYVLRIHAASHFALILLINLIIAGTSLALGTLLSAFARNEFQLFQFIPVVIIPQGLFCGLFDLREAPAVIRYLAKAFPLTYGADALRDVMLRGRGPAEVWPDLLIMLGFMALFILLNIRALRKYRDL